MIPKYKRSIKDSVKTSNKLGEYPTSQEDLIIWPDGIYCDASELSEYSYKSDDYLRIPYSYTTVYGLVDLAIEAGIDPCDIHNYFCGGELKREPRDLLGEIENLHKLIYTYRNRERKLMATLFDLEDLNRE